MAQRFFGKKPSKKYVRPMRGTVTPTVVEKSNVSKEKAVAKKNNTEKTDDMDAQTVEKIEGILNGENKAPKRKVKVEKKDKELVERAETILMTEDNRYILND